MLVAWRSHLAGIERLIRSNVVPLFRTKVECCIDAISKISGNKLPTPFQLPPPLWGRVGVGGFRLAPPLWGRVGVGGFRLAPPLWGRVGVGGTIANQLPPPRIPAPRKRHCSKTAALENPETPTR